MPGLSLPFPKWEIQGLSEAVAQLIDYLPRMHKALDSITGTLQIERGGAGL